MNTHFKINKKNVDDGFVYHINEMHQDAPLVFGDVNLVQIGRMFCSPTTVINPHLHVNWYELTIVKGGRGEVETNGQRIPVREGDIYLSLPCDTHAIYSDELEPLRYDFFSFFTLNQEKLARLESLGSAIYPADRRFLDEKRLSPLVSAAIEEIREERADSKELLDGIFSEILIYLMRAGSVREGAFAHHDARDVLCFKIMNYIDTHIYSMKNLYELCEITNYNYSYLSCVFRETTGTTLSDYFRKKRLDAARTLLSEGKLKIGEIASLLGYSSIYAFSKAFKARFGAPPKYYTE